MLRARRLLVCSNWGENDLRMSFMVGNEILLPAEGSGCHRKAEALPTRAKEGEWRGFAVPASRSGARNPRVAESVNAPCRFACIT
jgi:hypothetical protein